jgi:alkylation response protein AidB-like acyl-CoA dehydrogenase
MKIGGAFLTTHVTKAEPILTKENMPEEVRELGEAMVDFARNTVGAKRDEIEKLDYDLLRQLMAEAGEMGFTGIEVPEEYGGLDLGIVPSMLSVENIGYSRSASFAVTFVAHAGIGTLPVALFGTVAQKEKYLEGLASGQLIGAYCLTEPSAGSDALSIKTTAVLDEAGENYIINGQKQFITNGGFADVYTVFAKIDGEKFTAFLVDAKWDGVTPGKEEHKMGMKGSSTTSVKFENVKVPKDHLMHEIGKGHEIAFNILNLGRLKLGVADLGGCKMTINDAVKYAKERRQFGQPIADFDQIKLKFADMFMRTFAVDSAAYRTFSLIESKIDELDHSDPNYHRKALETIENYAIEASMIKVYGSEYYADVIDHGVQILGGYGFTEEYSMAQTYRDARVERLYEGTNEVNRQVITGYFLKNALLEQIPLRDFVRNTKLKLLKGETWEIKDVPLSEEKSLLEGLKIFAALSFNEVISKYGQSIRVEQMVMEFMADVFTELYFLESMILRTDQALGTDKEAIFTKLVRLYAFHVLENTKTNLKDVLFATLDGPELKQALQVYNLLANALRIKDNFVQLRRDLAEFLYDNNGYPFN